MKNETEISRKRKWRKVKGKTGCADTWEKRKIQDAEIASERGKTGYRR